MSTYKTFDEAYMAVLHNIYYHADFFNQPRGFNSRERLGVSFKIQDPTQRVVYSKTRKINIIFNFAEALWYLSGDNSLDYMSYYNQRMPNYSVDGKILTGTAYGKKIFHFGEQQLDQWQRVKKILSEDPDSKRAVMQIFDANELTIADNLDVSCTLGLQFFIRNNRLNMVSYMRANDAFRGIVSDVFSFTMIQELMARDLNIEVGEYYHTVGTMHIYQTDDTWVSHVLEDPRSLNFKFPMMPSGNNWDMIKKLMKYEKMLRKNECTMDWQAILDTGLSPYWQQILALFSIYQMIYFKREVDYVLFDHLIPIYKCFLTNKWPKKIVSGEVK